MGYWDGMYGYGVGPSFIGPLGMLLWFIFWVLVIILVADLLRRFWGGSKRGSWDGWKSSSALDVLKERYAKGEIDTAEYEERKKTLLEE